MKKVIVFANNPAISMVTIEIIISAYNRFPKPAMLINSILIVDEDFTANYQHVELIRKLKVAREVFVKNDGDSAYEFLRSRYYAALSLPSLIILNISMSGNGGVEFLNNLVSSELLGVKNIPVAILNCSDEIQDLLTLKVPCLTSYHEKPLNEEKLLDILTNTANAMLP